MPPLFRRSRALTISILVVFVAYGHQLGGGWRFDDPHHLLYLSRFENFQYFYDLSAARQLSGAHYTPFNMVAYDVPRLLFSPEFPAGYYAFHLLLIAAASALFYRALKTLVSPFSAAGGSIFFALGFPLAAMSGQLMVGHYLIGACFWAACIIFYDRARQRGEVSYLSVAFFFLACLSKEIFLPLFALLVADPRVIGLTKRARLAAVYGAAALAFWSLRAFIIGAAVGGYNAENEPANAVRRVAMGVLGLFSQDRPSAILGVICIAAVATTVLKIYGRFGIQKTLLLVSVIAPVALAPLVPVSYQIGPQAPGELRLVTVIWMLLSACIAATLEQLLLLRGRATSLLASLAILAPNFAVNHAMARTGELSEMNKAFDAFSEHLARQPQCQLVDHPIGWSSWAYDLQQVLRPGGKTAFVAPEEILLAKADPATDLCKLENAQVIKAGRVERLACDESAALSASLAFTGTHIHVEFGPRRDLPYYIEVAGKYVLKVPASFYGPLTDLGRFSDIRVYAIPETGKIVCSPTIHFDPRQQSHLSWERTPAR